MWFVPLDGGYHYLVWVMWLLCMGYNITLYEAQPTPSWADFLRTPVGASFCSDTPELPFFAERGKLLPPFLGAVPVLFYKPLQTAQQSQSFVDFMRTHSPAEGDNRCARQIAQQVGFIGRKTRKTKSPRHITKWTVFKPTFSKTS